MEAKIAVALQRVIRFVTQERGVRLSFSRCTPLESSMRVQLQSLFLVVVGVVTSVAGDISGGILIKASSNNTAILQPFVGTFVHSKTFQVRENLLSGLLVARACPQGYGVCSNTGSCCPLGGACCSNGGEYLRARYPREDLC